MAEPRKRLIFSKSAEEQLKPLVPGMPQVFGGRTRFIVMLAVNGPCRLADLARAMEVPHQNIQRMQTALERLRICTSQHHLTFKKYYRFCLDPRHPTAYEIAALARRLDEAYPTPRVVEEQEHQWLAIPNEPPFEPGETDIRFILHGHGRTGPMLLIAAAGEIERHAIGKLLRGGLRSPTHSDVPQAERLGLVRTRRDGVEAWYR